MHKIVRMKKIGNKRWPIGQLIIEDREGKYRFAMREKEVIGRTAAFEIDRRSISPVADQRIRSFHR